jgi:signal peptidase I
MAYSTNPFSVATFGESYEQADIAVVLTGVAGTGAIDTGIDVSSRTTVDLTGTQGDGAIGAPTPQAEATTGTLTGVQATGTANTVTATGGTGVVFTPSSVSATGATNDVTIVAKAVTVPTGVEGDIITDDPLVTGDEIVVDAEATFAVTGVSGASATNSVTVISQAVVLPVGVEGDIITDSILVDGDEVVIDADANLTLDGVGGTTALNTVTLDCKAVVIPTGVQGTFTVGDETINTVQFDYEAIKTNYSRDRTAYIGEYSTLGNTVYVRAA